MLCLFHVYFILERSKDQHQCQGSHNPHTGGEPRRTGEEPYVWKKAINSRIRDWEILRVSPIYQLQMSLLLNQDVTPVVWWLVLICSLLWGTYVKCSAHCGWWSKTLSDCVTLHEGGGGVALCVSTRSLLSSTNN